MIRIARNQCFDFYRDHAGTDIWHDGGRLYVAFDNGSVWRVWVWALGSGVAIRTWFTKPRATTSR